MPPLSPGTTTIKKLMGVFPYVVLPSTMSPLTVNVLKIYTSFSVFYKSTLPFYSTSEGISIREDIISNSFFIFIGVWSLSESMFGFEVSQA